MESIAETSCLSDDVKESVTKDFSWIRDEALQEMGGRDYEDQTDLARRIEEVAKGILRKLGLPTETEANLDSDVDELPRDPVDLFQAIWDEATCMMLWGLAASPCCARRIFHLARAVEQWHEAAGNLPSGFSILGEEEGVIDLFALFLVSGCLENLWREDPSATKEPGKFGDPFGLQM